MSDETKVETSVSGEDNSGGADNQDYLAAIQELKAKTVSKESYDAVKAENKRLLQAFVNGEKPEGVKTGEPVDVSKLRKKILTEDLTNLEYVDTALKLRDALIEEGERDPFLPVGSHITISSDMVSKAENTAKVLRECVDAADGDSGVFTAELQRRMKDNIMPVRRGR